MSFLGCASEILQGPGYAAAVAHYLFNFVNGEAAQRPALREQAAGFLRVRMWGVDADEPHRDALAAGDLVLVYLGAPDREFIGRAELASAVHDWTPSEAQVYPGDSPSGVSLAQVEEWDAPVPMNAVLSQIDPAENARADFETGVVRITTLTNLRPPSPWRPDARSRRSPAGRLARVTFANTGAGSCSVAGPSASGT
jgi:hypothetical protein